MALPARKTCVQLGPSHTRPSFSSPSVAESTSVSDPHRHRIGRSSKVGITCVGCVTPSAWSSSADATVSIASSVTDGLRRPFACRLWRLVCLEISILARAFFLCLAVVAARALIFFVFLGDLRPADASSSPAGFGCWPPFEVGSSLISARESGRHTSVTGTAPPALCGAGGGQGRALQTFGIRARVRAPGPAVPGPCIWDRA